MYNLLIALGTTIVGLLIFGFALGNGQFRPAYGIVPGLMAGIGLYIYLARRSMNKAQELMLAAQAILSQAQPQGNKQPNPKIVQDTVDKAIALLKSGYVLGKWQFLIKQQLDGQIGQLLYMIKRYDVAEKYLKKSLKRNWIARAMLGAAYYKRKKFKKMGEVFEEAVTANKKESLLWNLYAYCLWKQNKREDAIKIINRALEHVPGDERTKANLKALQNNKKMKMRGWNMMWYQFHLDQPPAIKSPQMRFRR